MNEAEILEAQTFRKTESEIFTLDFNFEFAMQYTWRRGTQYTAGQFRRPTSPNGFEYECTTGGQAGSKQPKWPTTVGQTVNDGSAVWTARKGSSGRDAIASVLIAKPADLTVGVVATIGAVVSFPISAGFLGSSYEVSVEVTTVSGELIEKKRLVSIIGE